jgi:hypothetical protein
MLLFINRDFPSPSYCFSFNGTKNSTMGSFANPFYPWPRATAYIGIVKMTRTFGVGQEIAGTIPYSAC